MYRLTILFALLATTLSYATATAKNTNTTQQNIETQRLYLSGHGCDDMVDWDFFCSDGRNSGQWTTIGVPSCWELQGFGTYQYGMRFYGKSRPEGIASETGRYKHEFCLPQEWEGRQILLCFEASMTDTYCDINGRKAGTKHKGGFTPFYYDVSDRIFFGKKKNRIEVTVDKESEEDAVNMAERRADYWNFGGIIRPVFIISKPAYNVSRVAIDARHDGHFVCNAYLNRPIAGSVNVDIVDVKTGRSVAQNTVKTNGSDNVHFDFNVKNVNAWSAETPHRYEAVFTLADAEGNAKHIERQKFGFRTIEVREHDGVYVNGQKMMFRGVNRHSFRPETGRTLSYAKNMEDVKLIRSMNMNAVRLSHYPADPEFLDICDSLGLYVISEHPGWHWHHNTVNGSILVADMIKRDQNHPSIIFWDNGNEGGFNMELDPVFHEYDLQKRTVLYPWANEHGMETKHYRSWGETQRLLREPEITMPTEFLHGLYDGGHGAGLYDYWKMMTKAPRCAGGFLWDLADEGVKRVDMDGVIDNVGNFGADGIVGPHFEKEGSYFTIKEIWSPVQVTNLETDNDEARLSLWNRYDFMNLRECKFRYEYKNMPDVGNTKTEVVKKGVIDGPDVAPHAEGELLLPRAVADVLEVTAVDNRGEDVFTWSMRTARQQAPVAIETTKFTVDEGEKALVVNSGGEKYTFCKKTGHLVKVETGGKTFNFDGPRFIAAKRSDRSQDGFYNHDDKEAEKKKTEYTEYEDEGVFAGFKVEEGSVTATYNHGSLTSARWTFLADGSVRLDYEYQFGGVVDEMGVMFDYPEQNVKSKQWVGDGPYRVWQNRLHGPQYGYWQNDYNDPIPAESFDYPEFKGYFANVSWMQLNTSDGTIQIRPLSAHHSAAYASENSGKALYVGVYEPRDGRDHLLYTLPKTGISLLNVIPAVRNKVNTTDLNGPSAQPYWADLSPVKGSVVLSFK